MSEITYCGRTDIDKALEEKLIYLKKEDIKITVRLLKYLERIDRKTGSKNTVDDIKAYYDKIHTIKDARLRNLIKDAYKMLEKVK